MSQTRKLRSSSQHSIRKSFEGSTPWKNLKRSVLRLDDDELKKEDDEHLNVFHYAIKSNNLEAVEYFLSLDTLSSKDHSPTVPYFHYAAYTGTVEILKLFSSKMGAYCSLIIARAQDVLLDEFRWMDQKLKLASLRNYTPLDIAVAGYDWRIINYLLEDKDRSRFFESPFVTAAHLGSAECMRYLVDIDPYSDCIKFGFHIAFMGRKPNCMELLLNTPSRGDIFQGLSPFHILYNETREGRPNVQNGQGLLDCTEMFLRLGYSVDDPAPRGAYPLYSIIERMVYDKEQEGLEDIGYHIECLKLLLEEGADPNFQEGDKDYNLSYAPDYTERDVEYDSSFEALFYDGPGLIRAWDNEMDKFYVEVIPVLVECGANVQGCDAVKSALYCLFEKISSMHFYGEFYVPHQTISLLMSYGCSLSDSTNSAIDSGRNHPLYDVKKATGPLGVYFEYLFDMDESSPDDQMAIESWRQSEACYNIARYFSLMNVQDGETILEGILRIVRFNKGTNIEDAIEFIRETFSPFLNRNLFTLCTLVVHKSMGANWSRLDELELPVIVTNRMKALLPP